MFSVVGLSYSSAIGIRWATSARARHSHWLAGFHVDADRPDAVGGGQLLHQDRDVGLDEILALGFQESSLGAHFIQLVSNELEKKRKQSLSPLRPVHVNKFRVCWLEFYRYGPVFSQLFLHLVETPLAQPAQARKLRVIQEMWFDVGKRINTQQYSTWIDWA